LGATLALYLLFLSGNGVIGLLLLASFPAFQNVSSILWLAFAGMTASILFIWLPFNKGWMLTKIAGYLQELAAGWDWLRKEPRRLVLLLMVQFLTVLLFTTRLWLAFRAISQQVGWQICLLFAAATILTQLVSITPGSLGIREGIVAGLGMLLGMPVELSIVAVTLDRLVSLPAIAGMGIIYTAILSRNVSHYAGKKTASSRHNSK